MHFKYCPLGSLLRRKVLIQKISFDEKKVKLKKNEF
jgi:hypothetical protein